MARIGMIVQDGIGPVLDIMVADTYTHAVESMQDGEDRVLAYAQSNAPWADITGAARQGLNTSVHQEGGEIVLELAHGVDYGFWLEVIQDGRFAIIMPTLEALGPQILADAGRGVMQVERF